MGRRDCLTKKNFFFYLVGSPKVGGAGDGKHKKKYGHPYIDSKIKSNVFCKYQHHTCIPEGEFVKIQAEQSIGTSFRAWLTYQNHARDCAGN